jgi:hypothetical protein
MIIYLRFHHGKMVQVAMMKDGSGCQNQEINDFISGSNLTLAHKVKQDVTIRIPGL